jgi:hypothetical protein
VRIENQGGETNALRERRAPRLIASPDWRRLVDSRQIFALEIAGSLLLFLLIARWYWSSRLAPLSLRDALTPLLLLHLTRTLGLTMLVSGVIDPDLPQSFAVPAAYGDLIAAVLALSSIAALRMGLRTALAVTWIFSLAGIGDLVDAFMQGARVDVPSFEVGAAWFIYTVLVPVLLVTHGMVVARLVRHARDGGGILINRDVTLIPHTAVLPAVDGVFGGVSDSERRGLSGGGLPRAG